MLKFKDAITLALTKISSQKIWHGFFLSTEIILLTGVLLASSFLQGFKTSLHDFNNQGLNGKFIVTARNVRVNPDLKNDQTVWDLAESLYDQHTKEHANLAAQLNLPYDPASEEKPTEYLNGERIFKEYTKYAGLAIDEKMQGYHQAGLAELLQILNNYPYQKVYSESTIGTNGNLSILQEGHENLQDLKDPTSNSENPIFYGLHVLESAVYQYYLFDSADLKLEQNTIPVTMSLTTLEQYFDYTPLSDQASSEAKLARFREIYQRSQDLTITTCYRNEASKALIFQAQQIQNEIARHANEKDYNKPSLIYNLPSEPCDPVTVAEDTRSNDEIQQAQLQIAYQTALGEYEEPVQKIVNFKVIGIIPDIRQTTHSTDILAMIQSLGGINLATPLISRDYYEAHLTELSQIFHPPSTTDYLGTSESFLIEFKDANTATRFINEQSCTLKGSINNGCATEDKPFYLTADNNHSLIINNIIETLTSIIMIAILMIFVLTIILMTVSIMRSISSDRKEIAIFKATGFQRTQIITIYLTYTCLITSFIILVSIILTLILGLILNPWLSSLLTTFLQASFFNLDNTIRAQLFEPQLANCLLTSLALLLVSLTAALLPTILKTKQSIIAGLKYE